MDESNNKAAGISNNKGYEFNNGMFMPQSSKRQNGYE